MENQSHVRKLAELIQGIPVAMLTTLSKERSRFHSRPMWTQAFEIDEFEGALWFFTAAHSSQATELLEDDHVALSYCDSEDSRYVAVTGRAHVVQDNERAKKYWKPIYQTWFPKGLDDPGLRLLCVKVERAEYWDSSVSKVVQLLGFVKNLAGPPQTSLSVKHDKLDLTG